MEGNVKKNNLVLLPTLNEKTNITFMVSEILTQYQNVDILIVDGCSSDGTWEEIQELKNDFRFSKRITAIKQESRLGLASAHLIGFIHSIINNYENLITMDSDRSHQPKELYKFISKLNEYDLVVG